MDLVLRKKLLALQAENSMLKEELQKLQKLTEDPFTRIQHEDLHQDIDDAHSRLVPEHKGLVKAHLDAIVARTGKPLDNEDAIDHVMNKFVVDNPAWQNAAGDTVGSVGDYSHFHGDELYREHLTANTRPRRKIQEVLDTPQAQQRYLQKAKRSIVVNQNEIGSGTGISVPGSRDDRTYTSGISGEAAAADKIRRRARGIRQVLAKQGAPTQTLKTKDQHGVHQTLHRHDGKEYVVSSNQDETLIFPSDGRGSFRSLEVGHGDRPDWGGQDFDPDRHHTKTFQDWMDGKNRVNWD